MQTLLVILSKFCHFQNCFQNCFQTKYLCIDDVCVFICFLYMSFSVMFVWKCVPKIKINTKNIWIFVYNARQWLRFSFEQIMRALMLLATYKILLRITILSKTCNRPRQASSRRFRFSSSQKLPHWFLSNLACIFPNR